MKKINIFLISATILLFVLIGAFIFLVILSKPSIELSALTLRVTDSSGQIQNVPYEEGKDYYLSDSTTDGMIGVVLKAKGNDLQDVEVNADCDIQISAERGQASVCGYLGACSNNGFPNWGQMNPQAVINAEMNKIIILKKGNIAMYNFYISSIPIKDSILEKYGIEFKEPYLKVTSCNIQFVSQTQHLGITLPNVRNYYIKTSII